MWNSITYTLCHIQWLSLTESYDITAYNKKHSLLQNKYYIFY